MYSICLHIWCFDSGSTKRLDLPIPYIIVFLPHFPGPVIRYRPNSPNQLPRQQHLHLLAKVGSIETCAPYSVFESTRQHACRCEQGTNTDMKVQPLVVYLWKEIPKSGKVAGEEDDTRICILLQWSELVANLPLIADCGRWTYSELLRFSVIHRGSYDALGGAGGRSETLLWLGYCGKIYFGKKIVGRTLAFANVDLLWKNLFRFNPTCFIRKSHWQPHVLCFYWWHCFTSFVVTLIY